MKSFYIWSRDKVIQKIHDNAAQYDKIFDQRISISSTNMYYVSTKISIKKQNGTNVKTKSRIKEVTAFQYNIIYE